METLTLTTSPSKLTANREVFIDFVDLLMSTEKIFDMVFIQDAAESALSHLDLHFRNANDINLQEETSSDIAENYSCTCEYFFDKINCQNINRSTIKSLVNELTTLY